MAKYDLIYTVCNGDFMMDVCTGYHILSENRETAMHAAGCLESILSNAFDLCCYFDHKPKPHIAVHGLDRIHQHETHPSIINYKVQKNCDSSQKLLGYPVFSGDDFQCLTEADFIKALIKEYGNSTQSANKTRLTFECVSYGIEEHHESE